MIWGSWTELVVGAGSILVAGVLGYIAVKEAREASKWARRATELQEQANLLAEAALQVRFTARMEHEVYHDGDELGQPFDAWLGLESGESAAAVFVHEVETVGAYFTGLNATMIPVGDLFGKRTVNPNPDEELPKRLHEGETIWFRNPWPTYSPTPPPGAWAKVKVYYSVATDSPVRGVEVDVALPGSSAS